jgi:putative AlgH/UPF0301 family transcriptional regulator
VLFDPNFRRTVILVGEHGEEGAMGLVLNRASEMAVGDAVPDLADVAGGEAPVYIGGPVQPHAVLVLAEFDDPSAAATLVVGRRLRAGGRRSRAPPAPRVGTRLRRVPGWSPASSR